MTVQLQHTSLQHEVQSACMPTYIMHCTDTLVFFQATSMYCDGCSVTVPKWRQMILEGHLCMMLPNMDRWRSVGGGHINYNNCYTASNCVYIIMDVTLHCIIKCGMNCCVSYHNCDFNTVTQALKVLVATGANPHIQDNDGLTPADLAEECGHGTCARYLRSCPVPAEKSGTQVNIVVPIRYQSNHVSIDIIVDIFKVVFFVDFVTGKMARTQWHRTDPACSRQMPYLHCFSPFAYRFSPYWEHFDKGNIASMCSQYGLKRYANGLKWYAIANGASTASV